MTNTVKKFIEDNIDLIDDNRWQDLFSILYRNHNTFSAVEERELIDAFIDADVGDREELQWISIEQEILARIEFELNDKWDTARTWSRFWWIYDCIQTFGIPGEVIAQHLIDNKERLGLKMTPLESKYGWYATADWDLGWFDKEKFAKEYLGDR